CPDCDGLGVKLEVDQDLVIPDRTKTLSQGAIVPWNPISSQYYPQMLAQACESFGIDLDTPFEELPEEPQDIILNWTDELFHFYYEKDLCGVRDVEKAFEG
ncbi:excinuclease ABC subunit UvrA, partial [Enterococcus faecium]